MGFRIEAVDPLTAAAAVSSILQSAWKPPCLNYSPAYLAWQLSFPGALQPKVVVAFEGDKEVGCACVTQRSFIVDGTQTDAYVLSFVAVVPSAQGQGLATAIYAALLKTISSEAPVIAFAEPGSSGEHVLITSFATALFERRPLQPCRAIGYLHRPSGNVGTDCYATRTANHQDFNAMIPPDACGILWNSPTLHQFNHYALDPRRRTAIALKNAAGTPLGSGMIVDAEIISVQGMQTIPMLESMYLPTQSSAALRGAFSFAADDRQQTVTVMASNLSYLEPAVIKAAGARALPSSFNAYIFARSPGRFFSKVQFVNLEVI